MNGPDQYQAYLRRQRAARLDTTLLKWMVAINIVMTAAILWRLYE
jgi:hypothetical protein